MNWTGPRMGWTVPKTLAECASPATALGRPSRGGGPDELMGAGRLEPRPRAPQSPRSRVVPETAARRAEQWPGTGFGARTHRTTTITNREQTPGPQTARPGRGALGPDAQRPETRLGAPRPALEGHGGPGRAPPLRPAGLGPPTSRSAHTGGPATWRPGCAPLAGPSGARPARLGERPPTRGSGLTQKTKLKTKSRYLMHLVQPSTPMVARAAGGLRGAGRSWAAGAGPGRLVGGRWPGGRLGRADGGHEGRWRPGRESPVCLPPLRARFLAGRAPHSVTYRAPRPRPRSPAPDPAARARRGSSPRPQPSPRGGGAHVPSPLAHTHRGVRPGAVRIPGPGHRVPGAARVPGLQARSDSPKGPRRRTGLQAGKTASPPPSGAWDSGSRPRGGGDARAPALPR